MPLLSHLQLQLLPCLPWRNFSPATKRQRFINGAKMHLSFLSAYIKLGFIQLLSYEWLEEYKQTPQERSIISLPYPPLQTSAAANYLLRFRGFVHFPISVLVSTHFVIPYVKFCRSIGLMIGCIELLRVFSNIWEGFVAKLNSF